MSNKIRVGIVFGGRSAEHDVSLRSAQCILDALNTTKYDPVLVGITKQGQWLLTEPKPALAQAAPDQALSVEGQPIVLAASEHSGQIRHTNDGKLLDSLDVLFPILHGPYGEDGSIQGLAKLANIPCVGSGILSSAVGMDKDMTKRLLMLAGIKVADYCVIKNGQLTGAKLDFIESSLNYPVFVKPANMGSSIGISKANNRVELAQAVELATQFDRKVLVETSVNGREIECAVLGNDDPKASTLGEIIANETFYDYQSKYIDEQGASLVIPADVTREQSQRIQALAIKVFETLECRGLTRVDVFLTAENEIIVNEVNTLPGFTNMSMYPKLWEHSGVNYGDLIDQLIQFAIDDHRP